MEKLKKYIEEMKRDNRGIALLFSLGMLSLLLVLALSFAANSTIERKAAVNNDNRTAARLFAQSALNRALAAMQYYYTISPGSFDQIVSHDTATTNKETYDWLYFLNTTVDGEAIYSLPSSYNVSASNAIHWQYVKEGTAASDKIVGRYAYVVVGKPGRLDPSVTVDSGASGSALSESLQTETRYGVDVNEINLRDLDSTLITNTYAEKLSAANATPAGNLTVGGRWVDIDTLFSSLSISNSSTKESMRGLLCTDNISYPEAFWYDLNGDGIKETSELYHRFDMSRVDWDTTMQGSAGINILTGATGATPNLFTNAFDSTSGILWLKSWTDAGGMGSATACKNQIAANIIDYCDSDATVATASATSDYTDAAPTATTYVGLERCPYINEVRLQFEGLVAKTTDATTNDFYKCTVTLKAVDVELVNIYDTDNDSVSGDNPVTARAVVTVSGQYNWNPGPSGSETTVTFTDQTATIDISIGDREYKKGTSAAAITISPALDTYTVAIGSSVTSSVIQLQITKLHVKLVNASSTDILYDFSNIETDSNVEVANAADRVITSAVDTPASRYFDYSVDDPRQNLMEADWTIASGNAANGTIDVAGVNTSICNPNPGGNKDLETGAAEPWSVSTAYIRNAPMKSPWEIGLIHRGAKWETINLKKYYPGAAGSGAGVTPATYTDGDTNILDMIKMTSFTSVYGKVNLNTNKDEVLKALLTRIRVGSTWVTPAAGGTPITTAANITTLATAIKTATGSASFKRRVEIADTGTAAHSGLSVFFDGTCGVAQTKDATKEELISKFVNLTCAEPVNDFTVIAVAQSIKDIGGNTEMKDLNRNGTTGESLDPSSVAALGYINSSGAEVGSHANVNETITTTYGKYDAYADEILATQKIKATVQRNPSTGKFKVTKFEYLPSE